ncbi:hypothetical protein NE237_013139 [Protea cynaroides]|uniref:Ribosomal protein L7Ae/L30e/S12e/Gadd45 domain-containing protein n=1 Tax=Protea cynaroides TaxID=273540 RepID=A0A9Q0JY94_9MAGN|nr:hypothetical protein NE237_013139 [Protea cynaroides]
MRKKNKKARISYEPQKSLSLTLEQQQSKCCEGEHLDHLLKVNWKWKKPAFRRGLTSMMGFSTVLFGVSNYDRPISILGLCFMLDHLLSLGDLISQFPNVFCCSYYIKVIELEKLSKGALPEKIWIKQQFSIGVNDVTRVLERMMASARFKNSAQKSMVACHRFKPSVQLQAVILASDCNLRWLTKHLPSLAFSREVPLIFVKDNRGGSRRLGDLVKLKTAMAIGVKARGSGINKFFEGFLQADQTDGGMECLKPTNMTSTDITGLD